MEYPDISSSDFNKKFNKKFSNYKIPEKKRSFRQICFPQKYELQPQQKLLSQVINPKSPYKGILVFHNIGSGKTCTGITMCEQWKGKKKIYWVCPASLIGNTKDELRSQCTGSTYISTKDRNRLKTLKPSDKSYQEIIKQSDKLIDKYYHIYSYNKFTTLIKDGELHLRNCLLVIDEVQNMISDGGVYYEILSKAIGQSSGLHLVLLSATPVYDTIMEIPLLFNLLPIPTKFPTGTQFLKKFSITKEHKTYVEYKPQNIDTFKKMIKGYISYFPGAPEYTYPEKRIHYVKCFMEPFQYKGYLTTLKKEKKIMKNSSKIFADGQLNKLSDSFFIGTRLISNICFPNKKINEKGLESLEGVTIDRLQKYSKKFYKIIKKTQKAERTVIIYSNFLLYGVTSLATILEQNGYINFAHGQKRKKTFAIFSGKETKEYKNRIRNTFNNLDNIEGKNIKILLLSPSASEGVSFLNISQLHIVEPYWNMSKIYQIMGRGVRFCSHKYLSKDERVVDIYIYKSVHPNEKISIEEHMIQIAKKKKKLIDPFEKAIIEVSIDCELNKPLFNDPDIQCGL